MRIRHLIRRPVAPEGFGDPLHEDAYPRGKKPGPLSALLLLGGLLPVASLSGIYYLLVGAGGPFSLSVSGLFFLSMAVTFEVIFVLAYFAFKVPHFEVYERGFRTTLFECPSLEAHQPVLTTYPVGIFWISRETKAVWTPSLGALGKRPMLGLRFEMVMEQKDGPLLCGETFYHGQNVDVPAVLRALQQMYGERWPSVWDPDPIIDLRFASKSGPGPEQLKAAWQELFLRDAQRAFLGAA